MKPATVKERTVQSLHNDLLNRRFAVPKLQRNFVWDAGRAAKLLDSIYRKMPIGSLFLWEMDRRSANLIRVSAEVLPPFSRKNARIWFVIDGQQRLSVLYQAFEGENRQNDAGRDIDFGRLCFVPHPGRTQDDPPRIVYRKPVERKFVPVKDILAPDWRNRMPSEAKRFLAKVAECRKRLLAYRLPIVTVRSASLTEIGEVFIRVNSQGMRITSADRAIALMGKLDVRAMAQELRDQVRRQLAIGSIDPILMGFNLITERPAVDADPPKLEAAARRWSKNIERNEHERARFRKQWHIYQNGFLTAVDYLRRFSVYDETYLPSANMLATLAVFFFHHPGQPNRSQAKEIRKWFWATGVAQRYSGRGYHRNIVKDANFFASLAEGRRARFAFADRLDPILDIQRAEYSSHSARTRSFFCLLAAQRPRYLEGGEQLPLDGAISLANRKDRHHIFPRAQLSKYRLSARVYNSLCNICFLVSRENQRISSTLPRCYLAEYANNDRQLFRSVMRSHLIPATNGSGVWMRDTLRAFKQFCRERRDAICNAFEKEAGMTLFQRDEL
jgi:hypothetical protein